MLTKNVVILASLILAGTLAFPDGAPTSACRRMIPNHGPNSASLKGDDVPFELLAMPQENGQVEVFLRGKSEKSAFKGFLIMARDDTAVEEGEDPAEQRGHGYFVPTKSSASTARAQTCEGLPTTCADQSACAGTANAITHSGRDAKNNVLVLWTPPTAMSRRTVTFVATVVERMDVWYENVTSNAIDLVF